MTIMEAILRATELGGTGYSDEQKLGWLSTLDARVKCEILDTHEGGKEDVSLPYDASTDTARELLVPPPFDTIYERYMEAQIDYYNGDVERYNNAAALFNEAWAAFAAHYNRTHLPRTRAMRYRLGG
jgi:hypothetical protein